jgi:hypothetical protein
LLLALLITGTAQAHTYKDHLIDIFCTTEKREERREKREELAHTTIDCLGKEYATKYVFAHEWKEGLIDALYYSTQINRTPVIVLICKDDCQEPRARIKELALYYNIPLKVIKVVEHPQNSQIRK